MGNVWDLEDVFSQFVQDQKICWILYIVIGFNYQDFGFYFGLREMMICGCIFLVGGYEVWQVVMVVVVGFVFRQGEQIDQGDCVGGDENGQWLVNYYGIYLLLVMDFEELFRVEQVELVVDVQDGWIQC